MPSRCRAYSRASTLAETSTARTSSSATGRASAATLCPAVEKTRPRPPKAEITLRQYRPVDTEPTHSFAHSKHAGFSLAKTPLVRQAGTAAVLRPPLNGLKGLVDDALGQRQVGTVDIAQTGMGIGASHPGTKTVSSSVSLSRSLLISIRSMLW